MFVLATRRLPGVTSVPTADSEPCSRAGQVGCVLLRRCVASAGSVVLVEYILNITGKITLRHIQRCRSMFNVVYKNLLRLPVTELDL